jgi:hypothetical protein
MRVAKKLFIFNGARCQTRTGTALPPTDFKSVEEDAFIVCNSLFLLYFS